MSDIIQYDSGAMVTLFSDLVNFRKALTDFAGDMTDAGGKLAVAWEGNSAHSAFADLHKKWDGEFEDTLLILDRVAAEVENALHRALGTDGKIGDGFADLG
ncbi:WXG100 family type VII secretion target [Nocardia sp. NPDC055029]